MPIAQHTPKANILIDDQGNARLCDFGISRELTEAGTSGLTTTSAHTGTERYLSYELLEDTCVPTTASDVYALACTGLEVGSVDFWGVSTLKTNFSSSIYKFHVLTGSTTFAVRSFWTFTAKFHPPFDRIHSPNR